MIPRLIIAACIVTGLRICFKDDDEAMESFRIFRN